MGSMFNQVILHWIDKNGAQLATVWPTIDQSDTVPGPCIDLMFAAQNCSVARIIGVQYVTSRVIGGEGENGPYPTVYDRAMLIGRTAKTTRQLIIPAPEIAIFDSDNETVDMQNTDVEAFVAAVESCCGAPSGSPIVSVPRGRRQIAAVGRPF